MAWLTPNFDGPKGVHDMPAPVRCLHLSPVGPALVLPDCQERCKSRVVLQLSARHHHLDAQAACLGDRHTQSLQDVRAVTRLARLLPNLPCGWPPWL